MNFCEGNRVRENNCELLLPRLMTCITPIIVLFRQPSYLADIKFVCSHMAVLLLFFVHAAGILWGNMMGQGEEGKGGEDSRLLNAVDVPSRLCAGYTQAGTNWWK